jgi:NADH-quinone oxidoreductase subunit N
VNPPNIAAELANAYQLALPEIVLIFAACVLFVGGTFQSGRHFWASVSLAVLAGAAALVAISGFPPPVPPDTINPLVLDRLAVLIKVVAFVGGAVLVLMSWDNVPDARAADYYACLLLIIAGLGLTASANDLVMLFLALELISIPTYVILYLQRTDSAAREAAAKYFLLSIFAVALLLFGFSYLYGLTGTTNITAILNALGSGGPESSRLPLVALIALVMVAAGLGFNITAVPFHFYAPDVYQGTTLSSAALLAFVPKVAGFVALLRVLGFVWPQLRFPGLALGSQVPILFWILAAMTMTVGNILALLQDNVKRLLAYSSVAHAGYMLIGLAVAPDLRPADLSGIDAVLFYLIAYAAMTVGAFAALAYLSTPDRPIETVDDLAGAGRSRPGVALLLALFLFSLIGIPLTAGFMGKLFLFFAALSVSPETTSADHARLFRWLALIGVLNAAIGAYYYLRLIGAMYLRTPIRPPEESRPSPALGALWICAAVTIALGVYPQPMFQVIKATLAGQ